MVTKHFPSFSPYSWDLVTHSVSWMDQLWNADTRLLAMKSYEHLSFLPLVHHIRETSWFALGLLQRGADGDLQRACEALETILTYQFDEPGTVYDGTWYRYPEEPHPGTTGIWRGYDPNWREFIGTTLAIILLDYESILPSILVADIDAAIRKAVRGALARDLSASYSNIALMHAFLLLFAGERFDEPAWMQTGEAFAREVYRLFSLHATFSEFNSPTYYGVDLYALGLWRTYSSFPLLYQLGGEMEEALWRDIAQMYHASMKNIVGPFDRSYGMDMQRYATTIGMWIWMMVGRDIAPFPDITRPFKHALDFCFAPCYVAVDVSMPEDVLQHFLSFQGERQIERVIADSPHRVATAWIGNTLLLGGESTEHSEPVSRQFHPATIHWQYGQNKIGWVKLVYTMPVDAYAEKDRISISFLGQGEQTPDILFEVDMPDKGILTSIEANLWQLSGLTVQVETNARYLGVKDQGEYCEVCYDAQAFALGEVIQFILTVREL